MIFYIQSAHKELYKDFYELIQLFVYDFTLDMEEAPASVDVFIKGTETVEGSRYCTAFSATFKEKPYQVSLEEEITEKDALLFRKQYKRLQKRTLYQLLKSLFGKQSPWGSLTGVRPTFLLYEQLAGGHSLAESLHYMQTEFDLDQDKLDLLQEIVEVQSSLKPKGDSDIDVYIGIPFCATRCSYCTFPSNPVNQTNIRAYMRCIVKEIFAISALLRREKLSLRALYIGGGTPTAIDDASFALLLQTVNQAFHDWMGFEYTVEAGRADTISEQKLELMKAYGVQRISINPQTMNEDTLRIIGRNHTAKACIDIFYLARRMGFKHINMDTIVGLPGEGMAHFQHTMEVLRSLHPDSITVHTLALKKNSLLTGKQSRAENSGMLRDMVMLGRQTAKSMRMRPYYMYRQKNIAGNHENTAYALAGKECLYNVDIMEETTSILAAGAGAISKRVYKNRYQRIERAANVSDLKSYLQRIDEMINRKQELFSNEGSIYQ